MALMAARETSLNNALLVYIYGFGLGICGFGFFFFNVAHPLASGVITLGFIAIGRFFLTVGRVKPGKGEIEYRRLLRWTMSRRHCGTVVALKLVLEAI
jgi:hypothetical protein